MSLKTDRLIMRQTQKSEISDTLAAGAGMRGMGVIGIAGAEGTASGAG
jgi:hypothetical protein